LCNRTCPAVIVVTAYERMIKGYVLVMQRSHTHWHCRAMAFAISHNDCTDAAEQRRDKHCRQGDEEQPCTTSGREALLWTFCCFVRHATRCGRAKVICEPNFVMAVPNASGDELGAPHIPAASDSIHRRDDERRLQRDA